MGSVIPFQFQDRSVRVIEREGEPWFVAKDVADVLGYSRARDAIAVHCKGAAKHRLLTEGGPQEVQIIPERDVYRLIMRSRLPEAERFEDWVVGEVLPSIRKHGGYIQGQESDPPEIVLAKAIKVAESVLQEKDRLIAQQRQEIEAAAPKVQFHDQIASTEEVITVAEAAKLLGAGPRRLFAFLRKIQWLTIEGPPYQRMIDQGYMSLKISYWEHPVVGLKESVRPMVTGKGLARLQKLWREHQHHKAA